MAVAAGVGVVLGFTLGAVVGFALGGVLGFAVGDALDCGVGAVLAVAWGLETEGRALARAEGEALGVLLEPVGVVGRSL